MPGVLQGGEERVKRPEGGGENWRYGEKTEDEAESGQ